MEEFISVEPGNSDSTPHLSELPDITNWFSSYVYESFPMSCVVKENENDGFSIGEPDNKHLCVSENKDHNHMNKRISHISDRMLYESLPSEPPYIGNWFSSYAYESPMLDTSDGLELSVPEESECIKEIETEKETTKIERNNLCPKSFEQELASFSKVTDSSHSHSVLSEPPDVRNWFHSYEYQSPQLSDTHELGFCASEKDQLIIDESDTEEEHSSGIFRKTKSKLEIISSSPGRSKLNDVKENFSEDTAKEASSDHSYSDQKREKNSSVGLFDALTKEEKEESRLKKESLFCEPSFSLGVSWDSPTPQSPSKNEASLIEPRPEHIQETMSSSREKSPRKAVHKSILEEKLKSLDQESDDRENVHGESTETGFVTMKKARLREAREGCSMREPNRGVLMECSRSKELKKRAKEGNEEDEERKKKRRVLREMSNHQFSGAEEIAGKWRCPQKNKGKFSPPLKQLRLDAWIHKVV